MNKRPCAVCGKDQSRKKVWEKRGKQVICMACGATYGLRQDGTIYKRNQPTQHERQHP